MVVSHLTVGTTNWLENTLSLMNGPRTTVATWAATGSLTNLPINPTNQTEFFRVKTRPY